MDNHGYMCHRCTPICIASKSLQSISSLLSAVRWIGEENWPELKKNPTDAEGKVIEAERKWSMPLPGIAKKLRSAQRNAKNFRSFSKSFPEMIWVWYGYGMGMVLV